MATLEERKASLEKDLNYLLKYWLILEVIIPISMLVLIWPISKLLISLQHSFYRVFSAADLIPFSALLVLGVKREIESSIRFNELKKTNLENYNLLSLALPILILFIYGFLKYNFMIYSFNVCNIIDDSCKLVPVPSVDPIIQATALLSIGMIVLCIAFCFAAKSEIIKTRVANLS